MSLQSTTEVEQHGDVPRNRPRSPLARTRILASHLALSRGTRLGVYEITAPIGRRGHGSGVSRDRHDA